MYVTLATNAGDNAQFTTVSWPGIDSYCLASLSPLGGRIIFVSATLHYTGTPLQAHVGVAKAGVDALSNSVAIEFGPRGITSNIIAPGPIAGTEGMERLARKEDAAAGKKQIPLGRWGTVREIADATVYLFSEAASYVNGTTLVGKSELPLPPFEVPGPDRLVLLLLASSSFLEYGGRMLLEFAGLSLESASPE